MASVYKIEIEVVSDWVNFNESQIKEHIEKVINSGNSTIKQNIKVFDIKVKQKA
jgi:hypothetical protein